MKKHNLNNSLSSPSNDTGNAKALSTRENLSSSEPGPEWIFDSRATHHMVVHKNMFSSINSCKTEHIFVGNSSLLAVKGQGSVEMNEAWSIMFYMFLNFQPTSSQYIRLQILTQEKKSCLPLI